MTACPESWKASALLDGELTEEDAEKTRSHLSTCEACAATLEFDLWLASLAQPEEGRS